MSEAMNDVLNDALSNLEHDNYERIRAALAMGPTPGPWYGIQHEGSRWINIYQGGYRQCAAPIAYVAPCNVLDEDGISWKENKGETIANAGHVAACDPDTIRALLAERDALAATLAATEAARDGYRDDARALHAALVRMVAMYESVFDHEDMYKWRPEWLRLALALTNALQEEGE